MIVTQLRLKNWRNFREVDARLRERTYLLGANASGKSNLLDVFRFLRDIAKPRGGGLQKAISSRGGIQKLRCLHARSDPEVRIEVRLAEASDDEPSWTYTIGVKSEGKGAQRILISAEEVWKGQDRLLLRPDQADKKDPARLTQTALEQIQVNAEFRELATFFGSTTYLHLVPQLLKYGDIIGGQRLDEDPFGQGFLERVARTSQRTRDARLKKIQAALTAAVPQFKELRFIQDNINGRPHLEARYSHYRPKAGWQREEQFSDGTLRLIGLLWILLEGDSLLLLEEPELSLNDAIVREIPYLMQRVLRGKKERQVLISTHSEALLSNEGIDARGILLLEPGQEGSSVRGIDPTEEFSLQNGFSIAEVVLPKTHPEKTEQLRLWP